MSQTYQVCEVTVTLPSLGTITTDGAGNRIEHGDKCRVHLYAVKPDWRSGTIFEGFNVGAITFTGYTDSPFKRSQKIMVPDGYKLVALQVDDDGVPTSWDGLPVNFSGGYIGSPVDELDEIADLPRYKISSDYVIQKKIADALDTALVRHYEQFGNAEPGKTAVVFLADRWVAIEGGYASDEMRDAVEYIKRKRKEKADEKAMAESSPFVMKEGQVFIKDAVIGNGIVSTNYNAELNINNDGEEHAAGMSVGVEDGQGKIDFKADRFYVHKPALSIIENAVATNAKTKIRLGDEMTQAVIDAVRESDLFATLQANIDEQTASTIDLRQVVGKAVKAELNELKTEDTAASSNKNPELNAAPAMIAAGCLSVVESTESEIEKGTLSAVLANALHVGPPEKAMDTAIRLAKAVRAAFHELNTEDAAEN